MPGGDRGIRAVSNYAGCHHDVEAPIDANNHGVMFLNSRVRLDEVTDGLTHTIFVGEKLVDDADLGWMSGTRATLRNTSPPMESGYRRRTGISPFENVSRGCPENDPARQAAELLVGPFGSPHPGVVNFLFGDGAVRSVSESDRREGLPATRPPRRRQAPHQRPDARGVVSPRLPMTSGRFGGRQT